MLCFMFPVKHLPMLWFETCHLASTGRGCMSKSNGKINNEAILTSIVSGATAWYSLSSVPYGFIVAHCYRKLQISAFTFSTRVRYDDQYNSHICLSNMKPQPAGINRKQLDWLCPEEISTNNTLWLVLRIDALSSTKNNKFLSFNITWNHSMVGYLTAWFFQYRRKKKKCKKGGCLIKTKMPMC